MRRHFLFHGSLASTWTVLSVSVEWNEAPKKSPQASHPDKGRREVRTSPAFTFHCADGVSGINNITPVFMCVFDSDQDPPETQLSRISSVRADSAGCAEAVTG